MRRSKFELLLLVIALSCFGFDLFHFTHHLHHDPGLWDFPGVKEKILWKSVLLVLTLGLLFSKPVLFSIIVFSHFSLDLIPSGLTLTNRECEEARQLMGDSGIARDAKEGFLGGLKIESPRGIFPSEMDQVTWWGTFKPFEFWSSPEFEATWINPEGQPVSRSFFRGGACALAKTTLRTKDFPRGELTPGMWRVVVSCRDVTIDNHPFTVIGPSISVDETKTPQSSGRMILADEVNRN